ncbi:MAG: hypothetical protein HFJ34_02105 [Clostridia bacterium]|nr:hypothetical protein [Clostridia bacterium]
MFKKWRNTPNKKYLNIVIMIIIIVSILFALGIVILKYHVEGETNMPFELAKIAVISNSEGIDKQATNTKWAFDIYQSNDIFLYIDKNSAYGKTEAIKTVVIDNIQIEANKKDNIKLYKPDEKEEKSIFKNQEENEIKTLEYKGDIESNLKQLKISNQGGLVALRCSINNLAQYQSNDEEINHHELLKKAGVKEEDLKIKLTFDLTIKLEQAKEYKTTISLDLPVGNIIEEGTTSKEITDVKDFVFKR